MSSNTKAKFTGELFDVNKIAKLANLNLSENKKKTFTVQFAQILSYLEKLRSLPTEKVAETSQITGLENVTREDIVNSERTLTQDEALSNTKSSQNGLFKVKGVLNEE